jgi:phosphate transport system substrate-binding protein
MKLYNTIYPLALSLLLAACSGNGNRATQGVDPSAEGDTLSGTIQLSGAFALYPLAVRWAEVFQKQHPHVQIDISGGGAGKGITDALAGMVDIGMVSREVYPEELAKGAFPVAVTVDAVVPTINAHNPEIEAIRKRGITRDQAVKLWNQEYETWGQLLGSASKAPVHVYTRSDACGAAETFAAWLGRRQENLKGTAVYGDPGVAAAVQKDRVGIGFNNIAYVYDQHSKQPFQDMAVIPIDLNADGRITPDEDFYSCSDSIIAGIKDGRYPSPPSRPLYMVTKGRPSKPAVRQFLLFILEEGQQYAGETGYIDLSAEALQRELEKLADTNPSEN